MNSVQFQHDLADYRQKFTAYAKQYDGTVQLSSELETIIDDYAAFITNENHQDVWAELAQQPDGGELTQQPDGGELTQLIDDIRSASARCVAIMEKYRALKLLNGEADISDYFHNIEACIVQEFGSFQVTADSKVVLVGSGAFPMTPLFIAKQTGAEVAGIDIDEEAITLGRQVIARLGDGLNIRLESTPLEQLGIVREATHIIFSSTVAEKYELLDRLHAVTNPEVVVAMRYGDHLKSLFNYPMQPVDERKWRLAQQVLRPGHVFDIALYQKA